ncbi:MAG: bifunctional DNA-formamidopyrimidine glycosylase/DNA-(apurinic or apyrimidinic site) lyase [Pirellulales bacterium]|nr:bifunctional DNA-formamidopyrimidine glycosylase/DNA-(apurinic or apyrimidinic site) lyase [Pirellulales bacterium]
MPELPEVETMRRGVEPAVGARIERFERLPCPRKPIAITPTLPAFRRRVEGRRIAAAERIGKRVVLRLDGADAIVFEPRMTGLLLLDEPPDRLYCRVRLALSGRGRLQQILYWDRRGLGNVHFVAAAEFNQRYGADVLGPDALTMTASLLCERLGASRRAIKVALLDQKAVAGIGNLYAAEILHVAGVHPERECTKLTTAQWRAIADATAEVLAEAIRYEGSTLGDGTYRNALNKQGAYQNAHRVYDKTGQPCPRCGRAIERIVQAQRATFFCPGCQRRR